MNIEKVTAEISKIVEVNQKMLRGARQYEVSKKNLATLTEIGIVELMPKVRVGSKTYIGNGDAEAVIKAATDSGKNTAVFNASGEGEEIRSGASALYLAINEAEITSEVMDLTTNEIPSVQQPVARKIKIGDKVRVLPHTSYQHLSHGAVITPMIEHEREGYETTVVSIWQVDEYEDDNGDLVEELAYTVATGEDFSRPQIELL